MRSISSRQQFFYFIGTLKATRLQILASNLSMHEHLVACKQTCGLAHLLLGDVQINGKIHLIYWQLVLVSIYSFVRSFGIRSFRRDDIAVANKVYVLKKLRVRKLQDHLTFFFFFFFGTKMSEKIAYWS